MRLAPLALTGPNLAAKAYKWCGIVRPEFRLERARSCRQAWRARNPNHVEVPAGVHRHTKGLRSVPHRAIWIAEERRVQKCRQVRVENGYKAVAILRNGARGNDSSRSSWEASVRGLVRGHASILGEADNVGSALGVRSDAESVGWVVSTQKGRVRELTRGAELGHERVVLGGTDFLNAHLVRRQDLLESACRDRKIGGIGGAHDV